MKRSDAWLGAALLAALLFVAVPSVAKAGDRYERWGRRFGVRPDLLRRIARHESGMNPLATRNVGGDASRGGAWGLMQVTAATAAGLVDKFPPDRALSPYLDRYDREGPSALLDPDVNLMFGAFYLARLLSQFNGDEILAVAAYNRGAGGVRALLAQGVDPAELQYVQRVYA